MRLLILILALFALSGCQSLFREDPKLIGYVEKDNRTAITYYDNGQYVTYFSYNGVLLRTDIMNGDVWKVEKKLSK